MSGVISGFTVIFIVVGVGYVLGRTRVIGDHAHEVLSRLVFFVFTPALLFHSMVTSDLSVIFSATLVIAGGSAFLMGAVYVVIATDGSGKREVPPLIVAALGAPAPLRPV